KDTSVQLAFAVITPRSTRENLITQAPSRTWPTFTDSFMCGGVINATNSPTSTLKV
ncbi:unnamed protein product, partial [Pylaiella littoralis]